MDKNFFNNVVNGIGSNFQFSYPIVNSYNTNSNLSIAGENSKFIYEYGSNNRIKDNFKHQHKRTVYDAIHGHMELDSLIWEFIDTVEFQRLRNLKQLGNTYLIFPGGTHSRFEHSIGVAYLSKKLISHLIAGLNENYGKKCVFDINNMERINDTFNIRAVALAGLLHDLGHGPFSHLFDRKVIKYLE